VQALYQWQMAGHDPQHILREFVAERETINADIDYFRELTQGIPEHIATIQSQLKTVIDRPLDNLNPVERAVLYIGVYELQFHPEIPWRVVVDEAIELAKMFGATEAHRYVNGVLDRLARTLRALEVGTASRAV
jgi:N utilization substance protein B